MPRLRAAAVGTLTATALLASLTACGDSSGPGDGAVYRPLTEATFASSMTKAMSDAKTFHMGGTIAGQAVDMWNQTGKETEMKGSMGSSEVLLVDGEVYTRQSGQGKWTQLPPAYSKQMVDSLQQQSPTAMAASFRKSLKSLKYTGDRTSGGEKLHAYRLRLDTAYFVRQARAKARKMGLPASSVKPKDFPRMSYTVLLDDANLMRGLAMSLQGRKVSLTMDHWGDKVSIKAPRAGQVRQVS